MNATTALRRAHRQADPASTARQMTGEDHGPWFTEDEYPGQAPCPHCFESSGYVWEHGNDWNSGPYSVQTNIPCKHCNGTGTVDSPLVTPDDLDNLAAEEAPRRCKTNIVGASGECLACNAEQGVACRFTTAWETRKARDIFSDIDVTIAKVL